MIVLFFTSDNCILEAVKVILYPLKITCSLSKYNISLKDREKKDTDLLINATFP